MSQFDEVDDIRSGATYFPAASGVYEVKPGLVPLGTDLGNGEADGHVFQLDGAFAAYRSVKMAARADRLTKHYCTHECGADVMAAVCRFMAQRLAAEHPQEFKLQEGPGSVILRCALTGEELRFGADMSLRPVEGVTPPYADALDALACQVQEDVAIVRRVGGRDWTCAIHLCFPVRWMAEDKIGMDFVTMHLPVPGMEKFRRPGMVNVMIDKKPAVRFVWELTTDTRLNHHREPPAGVVPADWSARPFDPTQPRLYLRIEREVLWGFPQEQAALFAVRTSFRDCAEIRANPSERDSLCATIESMGPALLAYKGLAESRDDILAWLRG